MERMWDAGMPVQGSRQACEAWAVLPAQLHSWRAEFNNVHQKGGSAGGAATPQALSAVQNAEHGIGACTHRLNSHNRIQQEVIMTYTDDSMEVFKKKGD